MLISLYTGLRIGELLALKWENIDFTNKVMTVTCTVCDMFFENKSYHLESTPKSDSRMHEIPLTSELLGHSSPAITLKIYVHTDLDTKRNALNKITKKYRQNI